MQCSIVYHMVYYVPVGNNMSAGHSAAIARECLLPEGAPLVRSVSAAFLRHRPALFIHSRRLALT